MVHTATNHPKLARKKPADFYIEKYTIWTFVADFLRKYPLLLSIISHLGADRC